MATPAKMAATMKANINDKTGKTLPQWIKILKAEKLEKHGENVKFLKMEHGVTHGFANMIVAEHLGSGKLKVVGVDLVQYQYRGAKAELRPIYDAIIKVVQKFGKDVDVSPKKSYVSLRRSKQFAIVQASTKDRVDVGINLKGTKATKRLEESGSFNGMVSHRVRITDTKQVDARLIKWLKAAYDLA